jgi:hypothetical protein
VTDLRTGEFATDGVLNEPPSSVLKSLGWQAADIADGRVLNWLHRETHRAQGTAAAMSAAQAMSKTSTAPGALYDGSPPAALSVSAAVWDPTDDTYLIATDDTTNVSVRLSSDGGLTTTEGLASVASSRIDGLALVKGSWVFARVDASNWFSSSSPYTSWTTVSAATFSSGNLGIAWCETVVEGTAALLIGGFTAGTAYIAYTPAATRPTVAGDWTELTPATMSHVFGIATDGKVNVLAGSVGSTTPTIAYAGIADGGLSGDWTTVTIGGGSFMRDVVYDGEKFVAIDDAGSAFFSYDGVAWTASSTAGAASQQYFLATDPSTGFVASYRLTGGSGEIYASRDGTSFASVNASSGLDVSGDYGRWGFDAKRHRFFAGDGATVASLEVTG